MMGSKLVIIFWIFLVIFLLQVANGGAIQIVDPFPPNIYPIEGSADSVTCIALGVTDEVRFVRRTASGRYLKYPESERVFTTNRTVGDKIYFTLNFKEFKPEDDSTVQRYECWAHKIGDNTDEWDNSAKHGFSVDVIRKDSLPTVIPGDAVLMQKSRGQSFSIACNISIPDRIHEVRSESIHWLKNNEIIETVYGCRGKFRTALKPLTFSSARPKDGGNYSCILETKLKNTRPYNITGGPFIINIQPDFESKKLNDNEIVQYKGNDAMFSCSAAGFPITVKWEMKLRDEESWKTLDAESNVNFTRYYFIKKEYYKAPNLMISNIQYSDQGNYRCCIVQVNDTNRCQEFVLRVKGDKIEIVPPFPPNIYPIEGTTDSVTCIAQGVTDEVRFVRRTASGRFAKYPESERVFTTNYTVGDKIYFTLNFKEIKLEDDSTVKRYECWAHKIGDNTEEWDNSAKHGFNVQVIRRDSLPTVISSDAVLMQKRRGQSFSITCNISIPDRPLDVKLKSIHWLKNNEILDTIYADAGKSRTTLKPLTFSSASPKDGGNYSCILETKLKNIRPYNITGRPYIINIQPGFKSKKLDDNEIVRYKENDAFFGCSAVGYPITIKWEMKLRDEESWKTLDAESNVNDTRYHFIKKKHYEAPNLMISNIQYSDQGNYRCCIVQVNKTDRCQEFVLRVRDEFTSSSLGTTANTSVVLLLLVLLGNI